MRLLNQIKNFLFLDFVYRLQQLFIVVAHFILLRWMIYTLQEAGALPFNNVLMHFLGMAVMGAGLIVGTAWWAKRRHQQEISKQEINLEQQL